MAVHFEATLRNLFNEAGDQIVKRFEAQAKTNAPHDSGRLAASIHTVKDGEFHWTVSTHASGDNGFQYPARIEAGEPVVPSGKYHHNFGGSLGWRPAIWYKDAWHTGAKPSIQSHFMERTIAQFRI